MYENIIAEMLERIAKLTAEVEKLKATAKKQGEAPLKLKWNTPRKKGSEKQCAAMAKARAARQAKLKAAREGKGGDNDANA